MGKNRFCFDVIRCGFSNDRKGVDISFHVRDMGDMVYGRGNIAMALARYWTKTRTITRTNSNQGNCPYNGNLGKYFINWNGIG